MMVEEMQPGFRFYPTEEELISFYLHHKLEGNREDLKLLMDRVIPEVNIYDYNPWDLPKFSQYLCHRDSEQWFFFTPRQESEARGGRPNRLTRDGYWKATGSPGRVFSNNRAIGDKRTMVFYKGRAPNGKKTEWKMNEYKALDEEASTSSAETPVVRQEFCLCRIYKKSKSLRSFDRRPPPPLPGVVVREPRPHQAHGNEATITASLLHHHQASQVIEIAGLHETFSSADQGKTSQQLSENELWWDLDQLNYFCQTR